MSLIDKLNQEVEKGGFNKEDVETLINKALELSFKDDENELTTQDLLTAAEAVGSDLLNLEGPKQITFSLYQYVISYSSFEPLLPSTQEAPAQEPAPEAPKAEAPPEETPAAQEAPAQEPAPEAPKAEAPPEETSTQQEATVEKKASEPPKAKSEPSKTPKASEATPKETSEKKKESTKKTSVKKTNYHYSFSGADCDVYAYRSADEFTHLKTIATLSTSIYESKSPVRVLGSASPVGYTGSIRTIAGSMVFVLTEDHPLRELLEPEDAVLSDTFRKFDDTKELGNIMLSGMAAPFNILVIYKNEVGAQLMYRLEEVEIISEGIVSSVNDMITEMVFQFVALDMKQISKE